jgi:hypothetical protein
MFAGDADKDGNINSSDLSVWENDAGTKGYLYSDFNLDGQANNIDKDDYWIENQGKQSQVPD